MNKDLTQNRNQTAATRPSNLWNSDIWFDNFFAADLPTISNEMRSFAPAIDIDETADEYLVCADLPGVKEENIKIDCAANQLTISAERKYDLVEGRKENRRERFYGSYQRSFTLPQGVDSSKIMASYVEGVLEIHIPKGEAVKSRRIQVGTNVKKAEGKSAQH
jgi:HSP20 family protein